MTEGSRVTFGAYGVISAREIRRLLADHVREILLVRGVHVPPEMIEITNVIDVEYHATCSSSDLGDTAFPPSEEAHDAEE